MRLPNHIVQQMASMDVRCARCDHPLFSHRFDKGPSAPETDFYRCEYVLHELWSHCDEPEISEEDMVMAEMRG